jgi:ATP-dependent protease ClpP protease subunit
MRDQLSLLRKTRMMALSTGAPVKVDFRADARAQGGESHLYIYDLIDDLFGVSASMVVEALLEAGGQDLIIHLNSPGGAVIEAIAIYNNIKNYPGKVQVWIEGGALSAASFIAMAGDVVAIEASGLMMLHDAWDATGGNAAEHRRVAGVLDQASDTMSEIYAAKAGGIAADWREVLKAEKWYRAQEALDAGLVDAVLTNETAGASAKWVSGLAPAEPLQPVAWAAGRESGTQTTASHVAEWDALRESLKGAFK